MKFFNYAATLTPNLDCADAQLYSAPSDQTMLRSTFFLSQKKINF